MLARLSAGVCEHRRFRGWRLTLSRLFRRRATSLPTFWMHSSKLLKLVQKRYQRGYREEQSAVTGTEEITPDTIRAHLSLCLLSLCLSQACKYASVAPSCDGTRINRRNVGHYEPESYASEVAAPGLEAKSRRRGVMSLASVARRSL